MAIVTPEILNPLGNTPLQFTEEQLEEIVSWFDKKSKPLLVINDDEFINIVTVKNLMDFLALKKFHRRSFAYPSYGDIMKDVQIFKAEKTRMLTKEQVLYILNKCVNLPDLKHELKLAFKVFDTENRSFLEMDDLKAIVSTYGDTFDDAECIEMLRDANFRGDGNIFYEDFVESIFDRAPELYQIKAEYLYVDADEDPSVPPEPIVEEEPPPPPPPPQPAEKKKKGKKKK